MAQSFPMNELEIEVKNFGPISKAKFDLRAFTLFIGPSNSGKSYLSILLYALHRALNKEYERSYSGGPFNWEFPEEHARELLDWTEENFNNPQNTPSSGSHFLPTQENFCLPRKISKLVCDNLRSNSNFNMAIITDEIERCFGTSFPSLIRRASSRPKGASRKAAITLRTSAKNSSKSIAYNFSLSIDDSFKNLVKISPGMPLHISGFENIENLREFLLRHDSSMKHGGRSISDGKNYDLERAGTNLINAVFFNSSIEKIGRLVHYLPADRTGVMHAHRIIVSAAMQRATRAGMDPLSDVPVLSGVLVDFLERLVGINDSSRSPMRRRLYSHFRRARFYSQRRAEADKSRRMLLKKAATQIEEVAAQIEKTVLGGKVRSKARNSAPSHPVFSYEPSGWNQSLPLMLASSMVSELSSVVLYLRSVVAPGDVLIIEEPEAHLHPELQVEFVKLLAEVAKSGVRIILTTHSSLVLATVANLVFLEENDKQNSNNSENMLSRQDVGLWSFVPKNHPNGTVVKEIEFDPRAGGFPAQLDDAAMDLHNEWASIHNAISERDE